MSNEFTPLDIQFIRCSLATKTDEEIAEILEKPVEDVVAKINELTGGTAVERNNDVLNYKTEQQKKKVKVRVAKPKTVKKQNPDKLRIQVEQQWTQQKADTQRREMKRSYKTIPVDLSQLISVKLDAKTYAFVKPGTNIELVKHDYNQLRIKRQSYNEKNETT